MTSDHRTGGTGELGGPRDGDRPTWECDAGTVVGWYDGDLARATGIRYARAERFAAPVPEPHSAVPVRATRWAPACPQARVPLLDAAVGDTIGDVEVDEDCLRLSVTLPRDVGPREALPVMVWIHGGSYHSGAGDTPFYDPSALVREQRVVFVAITYRLGLLGWLGRHGGTPANLGLLDQVEALRWVQRNIAALGGDPHAVTVFGESAGGDAVAHLMVSDGTAGLFARAIIQSAPFGIVRGRAAMNQQMAGRAARLPVGASAPELVAAERRISLPAARHGLAAVMPFGVQPGHHPVPAEDDLDAAFERVAPDVEVLVGSNARETALFTLAVPPLLAALRRPRLRPLLEQRVLDPLTRRIYGAGVEEFAERHARGGGRGYRYRFTGGHPDNPFAACHISELPLLFAHEQAWGSARILGGTPWSEVQAQGRVLRARWGEFARTGRLLEGSVPGLLEVEPIGPG